VLGDASTAVGTPFKRRPRRSGEAFKLRREFPCWFASSRPRDNAERVGVSRCCFAATTVAEALWLRARSGRGRDHAQGFSRQAATRGIFPVRRSWTTSRYISRLMPQIARAGKVRHRCRRHCGRQIGSGGWTWRLGAVWVFSLGNAYCCVQRRRPGRCIRAALQSVSAPTDRR